MQKTSNFQEIPYFFKGSSTNPIQNPLPIPTFIVKKIFSHILELGPDSLKSMGALRSTCRFMWNVANTPALWKEIHKSLPLSEYANCEENDYYNLCKQYNTAIKNIKDAANGKYWTFESNFVSKFTKNIFSIELDTKSNYICTLFHTGCYKIHKEKLDWKNFGKFLINKKEKELEIFDLSSNKTYILNMGDDYVTGEHTFDELKIFIPSNLMCVRNQSLFSLHYNQNLKKIYMKTWDVGTGECHRTEGILDTSKSKSVKFFCTGLPYITKWDRKRKLEEKFVQEITIYDSGRGKELYTYSFQLEDNEDIDARAPHITDSYIVYCGIDNVLTFVNRDSGKKEYIDLGDKYHNLMAMSKLNHVTLDVFITAKICSKENIFIYYTNADTKFQIWDLLTGEKICEENQVLVLTFQHQILIHDDQELTTAFYDFRLKKKLDLTEANLNMKINDRFHFIEFEYTEKPKPFFTVEELGDLEIYDTTLEKTITLKPQDKALALSFRPHNNGFPYSIINAAWGYFLAIPGKLGMKSDEEGDVLGENCIFIFDLRNGKHLGSIPISLKSDEDYITDLNWFNGCLEVAHKTKNETSFIYIAFQEKNPFPPADIEKK